MIDLIKPFWPAPAHIHAYSTTRHGGYSLAPYDSLNLALHVGDDESDVETNRQLLAEALNLPAEPLWLNQVHGNKIICADGVVETLEADGSFAKTADKVCVVMTADCIPALITNTTGTMVAAIHAGWRGLANGILEKAVKICSLSNAELLVWLGPAIGASSYAVGDEVREIFIKQDHHAAKAFIPTTDGKWFTDLYLLATQKLKQCGVTAIYSDQLDTYSDENFFSARRDNPTGRMASLIWMSPQI